MEGGGREVGDKKRERGGEVMEGGGREGGRWVIEGGTEGNQCTLLHMQRGGGW